MQSSNEINLFHWFLGMIIQFYLESFFLFWPPWNKECWLWRLAILMRKRVEANVTIRPHALGPVFLLIYTTPSFRYIIVCRLNDSKTFVTTQCTISNHFLWPSLPLGGLKIWSKGSFWLVSILSPVENSKQNKSKNVLSYDIMSFHWPLSIPQYTQKISTHYSNNKLSKNGIKIKFSPPWFFCFFSLKAEHYDIYFF